MTQTAMVRGLARWADKNMTPRFTAGGLTRIGFHAMTKLAEANPPLAMQMICAKYPSFAPIIATVRDAATFEPAWTALTGSVEDNGCMTLDVPEVFPIGRVQTFRVGKADLDAIRAEMERAYKEELAAAKAVTSAGGEKTA